MEAAIWKSWAPSKCKTFVWLVIRNLCWIADRLHKRGLPHPERCPLCDEADETVQHILTSCLFEKQFWFLVLQPLSLAHVMPSHIISSFAERWWRSWKKIPKHLRKGFNSPCIHWCLDIVKTYECLCFWWGVSMSAASTLGFQGWFSALADFWS